MVWSCLKDLSEYQLCVNLVSCYGYLVHRNTVHYCCMGEGWEPSRGKGKATKNTSMTDQYCLFYKVFQSASGLQGGIETSKN